MEREYPLDIAKGIGIVLVVAGHSIAIWGGKYVELHDFIYSFHMPLFFGISGFLASKISYRHFVKEKAERFLIPFVFWTGFYYFIHILVQFVKVLLGLFIKIENPAIFTTFGDFSKVIFFANYSILYNLQVGLCLWFLPALFSMLVLRRVVLRYEKNINVYVMFVLSTSISFIIVTLNNNFHFHRYIPFGVDTAFVCLPFVYIVIFREKIYEYSFILIPFLFSITWLLKTDISVGNLKIGNYPIFFLTAIFGISMTLNLSSKIKNYKIGRVFAKIGSYSYAIYILHELIFQFWRPIANRIPFLKSWEILQITSFILGIIVPILIVPYLKKWPLLNYLAFGEKPSLLNRQYIT